MSRLRGVLFGAGLMALACGGKSEIMPAPDTGGAGGTGATGGVGGGGFGGGGFGGGGFGGGGFGGGGFGGGGFGGGGFGGVGGQPGLVQKLCDKLAMTCPLPGCVAELYDGLNMAAQYGCVPEYEKVLYCAIDTPITCDPGGEPQLSPQCQPALEAFSDCITGPSTCSATGGPGSCGIDCGSWGANCYEKGVYLYCMCSQGPKAGQSINLPGVSCGGNWDITMEKFCLP